MKIQKVIDDALTDPEFAEALRLKADKAPLPPNGFTDEAWEELLRVFADDEAELRQLLKLGADGLAAETLTLATMTRALATTAEPPETTCAPDKICEPDEGKPDEGEPDEDDEGEAAKRRKE